MLTEQTIAKMNAMRHYGMTEAFTEQLSSSEYAQLTFEERLGLLVDTEFTARENRKLSRRRPLQPTRKTNENASDFRLTRDRRSAQCQKMAPIQSKTLAK